MTQSYQLVCTILIMESSVIIGAICHIQNSSQYVQSLCSHLRKN
jgi:hypothetical protein